jgi:hypothetical protein
VGAAVESPTSPPGLVLVDAGTGRVVARLPYARDAWWLDSSHLVVYATTSGRADAAGTDTLDELDVTALSGGGSAHYDRSTTLPAVTWNGGDGLDGLVLYPHRG